MEQEIKRINDILEIQIQINKNNTSALAIINDIMKMQSEKIKELKEKLKKIDNIIIGMTINN